MRGLGRVAKAAPSAQRAGPRARRACPPGSAGQAGPSPHARVARGRWGPRGTRPGGSGWLRLLCLATLGTLGVASVASCGVSGTGTRDEGPARSDAVSRPSPSPSPAASSAAPAPSQAAVVRLLKRDPKVGAETKGDLKPCDRDEYPVDVSVGDLTGATAPDVLVNVMTCGDAVGVATYVYRMSGGSYVNVFQAEDPPVYGEIDRGDLVVTKQLYRKGDAVAYPSSEEVITYEWHEKVFKESYRLHNDYSKAVGGGGEEKPSASGG